MNQKKPINSGFTLIELLIYITLVAAISIIFTGFTADVVKNATRSLVVKEVNQNARLILSRITQEIKTAKNVNSLSASEITLTNFDNQTFDLGFDSVNNLVYIDTGSGNVAISSGDVRVTNLVFSQAANNIIEISVTIEQKNPSASEPRKHRLDLVTSVLTRPAIY